VDAGITLKRLAGEIPAIGNRPTLQNKFGAKASGGRWNSEKSHLRVVGNSI